MHLRPVVRTMLLESRRLRLVVGLYVGVIVLVALVVSLASPALADTPSFPDVPAIHQYYTAITDLASRSIIGGYANGNFGPGDPVTRQQFAKMIVLAGGYPVSESDVCSFTDVAKGDATTFYPDNFVAVCAARGITTGTTSTTFNPSGKITRYQVVSMVVRMADNRRAGLLAAPPAGWARTATWADNPTHGANAERAEYNHLLDGLDLTALSPTGNMSRGEVAQVLHNLLGKLMPGVYPVYGDFGIAGGNVQIWNGTPGPVLLDGQYVVSDAPEGKKCFAAVSGSGPGNYVGWGVFLGIDKNGKVITPGTVNLSSFKNLMFMVKTAVDLKVELQQGDSHGPKSAACLTSNYGWDAKKPSTWQSVSIPRAAFGDLDWTSIGCPFMITGTGGSITFYVDDVRWAP